MAKLGIMGGTFNPVHTAHLIIAQSAAEEYGLDRIMFLPNSVPPHKECEQMATPQLRLKMAEAAVLGNEKFFVSDYEISKGGISYTVDTLDGIRQLYPGEELYFIIGGDSVRDFEKWVKPDEIVKKCILLAYPREGIDMMPHIKNLKEALGAEIHEIHAPRIDISSSEIRQLIGEGRSVRYLVPDKVLQIINRNNLYKG